MKIRNVNSLDQGLRNIQNANLHDGVADKGMVFRRHIADASQEEHHEYMLSLSSKIEEQGETLGKKADMTELEKYRDLIREFLNQVVSNGYSFSKENTFESRGRHRVFAIVKKIDEKLEALAEEVLSDQADNLKILDKIDDIRGLILDIML